MARALLTTQPGWAFATLAELRARGVGERVDFHHRDSTLVLPAETLPRAALLTPADTCGVLAEGYANRGWDATRALVDALWRAPLRGAVPWFVGELGRRPAWTVASEVWGETQVRRRELAEAARQAMRAAFPRWTEASPAEAERARVRLVVKADTRAALLGVRLRSTLEGAQAGRPGALRAHLACGLLVVAGLRPVGRKRDGPEREAAASVTVLDPFAGSGTILEAAGRHFGVEALVGAETDRAALRQARERLRPLEERGVEVALRHGSFDELAAGALAEGGYLVSNLPFGERFAQVETRRLLGYLTAVAPRTAGVALLMAREQAAEVAERLGLRVKSTIVLGQPSAIAYRSGARI